MDVIVTSTEEPTKPEPVVTDGRVGNKRRTLIDTIPNGSEGILYFRDRVLEMIYLRSVEQQA